MAELIASGTTQVDSADFVLSAGSSATLFLKSAAGNSVPPLCAAYVQIKSGTEYFNIGTIDGNHPITVLTAAGTFRVRKLANIAAFGVDQN